MNLSGLPSEIEAARKTVRTDSYSLSIGEITNLYRDSELVINPNFQRLFRWEIEQKSRFVESILLGIPIPPIFVSETTNGVWELIDGLQRLSTLLEFQGLLIDPDTGEALPGSILTGTRYLPSLDGAGWDRSIEYASPKPSSYFDRPLQIGIKRARVGVEILKKSSDVHTKFELFQRLNAGGTIANSQEVRNAVIIMANEDLYNHLENMSLDKNFRAVTNITEQQVRQQRPLEYTTRYSVLVKRDFDRRIDVEQFIDREIIDIAENENSFDDLEDRFKTTFELLHEALGSDALRPFDHSRGRFSGKVGYRAFEVIAIGIGRNVESITSRKDPVRFVEKRVKEFWGTKEKDRFAAPGLRGTDRLSQTIKFGAFWFA